MDTESSSSLQVYLAAGAVYGLEGALGDLEQCARSISSGTTDTELAFLEDQVATAAAQVQQSELQVQQEMADLYFVKITSSILYITLIKTNLLSA